MCKKEAEELTYTLKDENNNIIGKGDLTGKESGTVTLAKETKKVDATTIYTYTLEIEFVETNQDQNHNMKAEFNGEVDVKLTELTPSEATLAQLHSLNPKLVSNGNTAHFDGTACLDESCTYQENGIYEAEDDDGTSYYFRGTVDNNWVKFGIDENGKNIWWRIIRINGNGTIRLIYSGTGTPVTIGLNAEIEFAAFNNVNNANAYVGYVYGIPNSDDFANEHIGVTDSNAKTKLDNWYINNLQKYEKYLDENTGYCGDRTIPDIQPLTYNTKGYGQNATVYGIYERVVDENGGNWKGKEKSTPTLKCPNKSQDLYTKNSNQNNGNKKLNNPIGLITADEVIYAGGLFAVDNYNYWLYTGQSYWTITPFNGYGGDNYTYVCNLNDTGQLGSWHVSETFGLRPVINLVAGSLTKGEGTADNPFTINN